MKAAGCNSQEEYQDVEGTSILIDKPNRRIRIMNHGDLAETQLNRIKNIAMQNQLGKIISFVPETSLQLYVMNGFKIEGMIAGFYQGKDAFCCSFFVSEGRINALNINLDELLRLFDDCRHRPLSFASIGDGYQIRDASEDDIPGMIDLFRSVFRTYPSPVFHPEYLRLNMRTRKVQYKIASDKGEIIGIASADKDYENLNAEMTDCVTKPGYRGQGILSMLLLQLENDLYKQGFICLYTLCRAGHLAVNIAFARLGYVYSGCMANNCHICGSFENMNIMVKQLKIHRKKSES